MPHPPAACSGSPAGGALSRRRSPGTSGLLCPLHWVLFALAWTGIAVAAPAPDARLPVLSVATDGLTPAEIGARLGAVTKAAFPDLEARWDTALASLLEPAQLPALMADVVAPLRTEGVDAATRAEVTGFAGALDLVGRTRLGDGHLSLDELWLVQFLPDLVPLAAGSALALHGRGPGGAPVLLGRNLDLPTSAALRGLQAITRWQEARRTLVSAGLAGYLGVLNGFNEHGLYAALLAGPKRPAVRAAGAGERAIGFAVRTALASRDSAVGAAGMLRREAFVGSHSVLLGDAGEALVLELPAGKPAVLRRDDSATRPEMPWGQPGRLAVVNCLVAADIAGSCADLGDRFRWKRLRRLAGAGAQAGSAGAETMPPDDLEQNLLDRLPRGYGIFNAATVQSMIFEPASGDLLLYAAHPDGAHPAEPLMQRYVGLARTAGRSGGHPGAWVWVLAALLLAGASAALWRFYPARSTKHPSETASTRSAT